MKAFTHLSLLTLLFVTSAISQNTSNSSTIPPTTTASSTAPANTTTPSTPANTTTPSAPANTTTPSAPANTTTPSAPANTTTPSAPANTTTPSAPANTTTPSAPANTTTPSAPANTTTPSAPANTTTPSAPTNTTATTTASPPSSVILPGPCKEDSCGSGASCVGLNNSYFCLCNDGYYYNSSTCNKGKVFPGTIKVNVSETSGLEDEKSPAYQNLYVEITKFFADAFKNPDYGQTVIHKVRTSAPARSEMRAGDKLVDVTVVNLFAETSEENETTVSNAINKAVASNPTFSDYTKENRCEFYGCVNEQDGCRDILVCKCKPGLSRPNPQTALCLALGPKCLDTCNAEHNMQCLVHSNGSSECLCLPGYQKDAKGSCQACAFGYSGVDCKDSFQLILTIVGTVAGILILGMVIALIFLRSKTKGIEEQNLIEDDYHSTRMSTTGFSNFGAEGSLFPKVRATFPKDSPMQNPYAQRSMPRPDY
ncbi:mucin-13 [Myotis yumanensis]|uniref:mucin-13 n=1 Tax=Myotis yumanensis TaxID=159337 RepID=UPI0038D0D2B8